MSDARGLLNPFVGRRPALLPHSRVPPAKRLSQAGLVQPLQSAIPFSASRIEAPAEALRVRYKSLDVMRGAVVVGMIVVNALAFSSHTYGLSDFGVLTHSKWAGFTFADFVFPAFIFMAGVSIAASIRTESGAYGRLVGRVSARVVRLMVLGFLFSNIPWVIGDANWRIMGVLQRIGICYFASAMLFATVAWRFRALAAASILLVYWPVAMWPLPNGQPTDLFLPGANFASWLDRNVLGAHAFAVGPDGFDPEGLLSTMPAIAQCLLGTLAGQWLFVRKGAPEELKYFASAGVALAGAGFVWSLIFPMVKNIWTSSYVLFSTGLAMVLLAAFVWLLDVRRFKPWGLSFFESFGCNAILAYGVHQLAQLIPASDGMRVLGAEAASSRLPQIMAFLPVAIFIAFLWLPLDLMRRKGWILKV